MYTYSSKLKELFWGKFTQNYSESDKLFPSLPFSLKYIILEKLQASIVIIVLNVQSLYTIVMLVNLVSVREPSFRYENNDISPCLTFLGNWICSGELQKVIPSWFSDNLFWRWKEKTTTYYTSKVLHLLIREADKGRVDSSKIKWCTFNDCFATDINHWKLENISQSSALSDWILLSKINIIFFAC